MEYSAIYPHTVRVFDPRVDFTKKVSSSDTEHLGWTGMYPTYAWRRFWHRITHSPNNNLDLMATRLICAKACESHSLPYVMFEPVSLHKRITRKSTLAIMMKFCHLFIMSLKLQEYHSYRSPRKSTLECTLRL